MFAIQLSIWAVTLMAKALDATLSSMFRLVGAPFRRPRWFSVAAAVVIVVWLLGFNGTMGLATALFLGGFVWRLAHRSSFDRWTLARRRENRRRAKWYRVRFQGLAVHSGLAITNAGRTFTPSLRSVTTGDWYDELHVALLPGQEPLDYEAQSEVLANGLGALRCSVRRIGPGYISLRLQRRDRLSTPVQSFAQGTNVLADGLPMGVREDGYLWQLQIVGSHVLIAGATGSGKGSVLWSIVSGLAPSIQSGYVQIHALDGKGGMELALGAPLFKTFETDPSGIVDVLEDAVQLMRTRAVALRGVTRLHSPTPGDPLHVVLVDELASLTAYVTDRDLKRRTHAALQLLLSQGRALGIVVVAALQDPSKEVTPFRDLFPTRIALRLTEAEQVDMVLGSGARRRGANCDLISDALPGVGFVALDGVAEPVRVRASYVSDDDIKTLNDSYGIASKPLVVTP